jgi:hypothetical protein
MDIGTIAAAATPILIKGVEMFSQKLDEKASEEIDRLYQTIRKKLNGDFYAEQTLDRAKQMPESKGRQAALEEVLAEKMKEDPDLAENVRRLVEITKLSGVGNVTAYGERSVAIGGEAKDSIIITGNSNVVGGQRSSND